MLTVEVTVAGDGKAVTVVVTGAIGKRDEHSDCTGEYAPTALATSWRDPVQTPAAAILVRESNMTPCWSMACRDSMVVERKRMTTPCLICRRISLANRRYQHYLY